MPEKNMIFTAGNTHFTKFIFYAVDNLCNHGTIDMRNIVDIHMPCDGTLRTINNLVCNTFVTGTQLETKIF